mgnify:CR=1 FL=1
MLYGKNSIISLISYERQGNLKLPRPYRDFMKTYGDGTYSGVICINLPDFHILNNYSQYDFWQYETAPITQEQIEECVVTSNIGYKFVFTR